MLVGPTEVLGKICDQFLSRNIASVVYITNSEKYGRWVKSITILQIFKYANLFHPINYVIYFSLCAGIWCDIEGYFYNFPNIFQGDGG